MSKYLLSNFKPLNTTNTWGMKVFARNFSSLPHGAASFSGHSLFFCCFRYHFAALSTHLAQIFGYSIPFEWELQAPVAAKLYICLAKMPIPKLNQKTNA